jgi:hypothetical protein
MKPWLETALRTLNKGPGSQRVFTYHQLKKFHASHKHELELPPSITTTRLVEAMIGSGTLKEVSINPAKGSKGQDGTPYKTIVRYARGDANVMELGLSLRPNSYLSHASAAELHGVLPASKTLYVNKEQGPKTINPIPLTQEAINLAFSYSPRVSNLVYEHEGRRIVLINGKSTNNLEVVTQSVPSPIAYTTLERTLIDITVRPIYAGGTNAVIQAFKNAAGQISLLKLIDVLRQLDYIYPYHQALGYYLQKSGYTAQETKALKDLEIKFDFFLTHGVRKTIFDADWRLYVPA